MQRTSMTNYSVCRLTPRPKPLALSVTLIACLLGATPPVAAEQAGSSAIPATVKVAKAGKPASILHDFDNSALSDHQLANVRGRNHESPTSANNSNKTAVILWDEIKVNGGRNARHQSSGHNNRQQNRTTLTAHGD